MFAIVYGKIFARPNVCIGQTSRSSPLVVRSKAYGKDRAKSAKRALHRRGSGPPAPNRAVHRAIPALGIRRLTGKPERSFNSARKLRGGVRATHHRIAVRTARKRVRVPVVRPHLNNLRFNSSLADAEVSCERCNASLPFLFVRLSREL